MGDGAQSFPRPLRVVLVAVATLLALTAAAPGSGATSFPPLPLADDQTFLSSLVGATLTPGGFSAISFQVADPSTFPALLAITLTLDIYAFNAFPGNATSELSSSAPPLLVSVAGSGTVANVSLLPLAPGAKEQGSVGVATADNTPAGTFAVRTALSFTANGTSYRLESRGWFSESVWAAATELPNGSTTLNLSVLGVSGVTAETAILVTSSSWDWALAVILGASVVLVGAGAFVYFRRGPKSSTGAR